MRSNIAFAVEQPSKQNINLRKDYFKVVKRVVQYLKKIL